MTIRSALAITTIVTSLASFTGPVFAQQVQTFDAWNHTFIVPGSQTAAVSAARNLNIAAHDLGSIAPERAYASAKAGASNFAVTPVQTTRTIKVWGARIDTPDY